MEPDSTFLPIKIDIAEFAPAEVPLKPGVYLFRDDNGRVLYVGKAINLRHRLGSYFGSEHRHEPRIALMLRRARSLEYILTVGETAALILENNLIKTHRPPFNVILRDDKTYPYVRITAEPFPRAFITRKIVRDGSRYIGPFSSAMSIRSTLRHLTSIIPLRLCKSVLDPHEKKRPCLNCQINLCLGPCAGKVTMEEYSELVNELVEFLLGKRSKVIRSLEERMNAAAAQERYEEAAHWRDRLWAAQRAVDMVPQVEGIGGALELNLDVIGAARGVKESVVALLVIREGRMIRMERFTVTGAGESIAELVASFLGQHYGEEADIPPLIILPDLGEDKAALALWLGEQARHKVELRTPKRGVLLKLLHNAEENAQDYLSAQSTQERERLAALEKIQQWLLLPDVPHRIEAIDASNVGDKVLVASSACLLDGVPLKAEYRHYRMRTVEGQDDFASIAEVVRRRLAADRPPPDLLLIDGGKGQLSAAMEAMQASFHPHVPIVALSKGVGEGLWLPNAGEPLPIPGNDMAARLLRLARDEAHRFAITYSRKKARGKVTQSIVDGIPGLGRVGRHVLLKAFPNPEEIKSATAADLAKIKGISRKTAQAIHSFFHPPNLTSAD
jgi:excinuclease ABC subunit C